MNEMEVSGVQISVGWAVSQAAETLCASSLRKERDAGRSLRCCEVTGFDRIDRKDPQFVKGTQGLRVSLRFYRAADLRAIQAKRFLVASTIAGAMGLWRNAIQLDLAIIRNSGAWVGALSPYQQAGGGQRLNQYLTDRVLKDLDTRRGSADWDHLAERPAEVRILLRRLRYQFGEDYGSKDSKPRYSYWTTHTTRLWARTYGHELSYLVSRLSRWSNELRPGGADPADSLDPGYWGEVDTERDPLKVLQLTTRTGTTADDVSAVLNHAGSQIRMVGTKTTPRVDISDPVKCFVEALLELANTPAAIEETDVLLVHRGGGLDPQTRYGPSNVPSERRKELLEACKAIRDLGIEVVVALGHANISVLETQADELPLGIFEATTPTAGASWILQEHINPRLVASEIIYRQPSEM